MDRTIFLKTSNGFGYVSLAEGSLSKDYLVCHVITNILHFTTHLHNKTTLVPTDVFSLQTSL